jgi:hypothetical protein
MKVAIAFLLGFVLAVVLTKTFLDGVGDWSPRVFPEQVPFEAVTWRESDSSVRGQMYRDLVKLLESDRPSKDEVLQLLGPSGYSEPAYLNGAEYFLIYHIDLGQRMSDRPFLDKLGVAFDQEGEYSHTAVWD